MLQFLLILLRNPFFLLGLATFVLIVFYHNRLVKGHAQAEALLEKLEMTLQKRKAFLQALSHEAANHTPELAARARTIPVPERVPMLEDDLEARFEEERLLEEEIEALMEEMDAMLPATSRKGFTALQSQAQALNHEIAQARQAYNAAARSFNLRIDSFPSGLIAGIMNVRRQELFL